MEYLKGKKILIIGGAFQHCKLVETAHKLGIITYVVDNLPIEKAPAKQISDYRYEYDITDYEKIVELCKRERIDGALSSHLDACQIPYQVICEKMHYPCFGTKEQFHVLTDKTAFIQKCRECGVDVIPQYSEADFDSRETCKVEFPVFVKPCDSRGSRGQTICKTFDDVYAAISFARSHSKSGGVVIEKYMEGKQDFSVTYFMVNGVPFLLRTCDRFTGRKEDGLNKQCIACISPSKYSDMYRERVHPRVIKLIRSIGISNGPVFMQGFVDGNTVRMYDPGLRFPGGEYERLFTLATGVSFLVPMLEYALLGKITTDLAVSDVTYLLNGKYAVQLDYSLKPGVIRSVTGMDSIKKLPFVASVAQRYYDGATIEKTGDVRQRLCEIALLASDKEDVVKCFDRVDQLLSVCDMKGENMLVPMIDPRKLIEKDE